MASTNKTTHYELSQYVGSDKPTYLTDYNNDMSAIDTGIYNAQSKADSAYANAGTADGKADTAITNAGLAQTDASTALTRIGTMSNLTTTEKTNLVGAVNEVNQGVSDNTSKIENFNLTEYDSYTGSDMTATGGTVFSGSSLTVATNADGSLAKIYGIIVLQNLTATSVTVTLPNTNIKPDSAFDIVGNLLAYTGDNIYLGTISLNPNGTITFTGNVNRSDNIGKFILVNSLLFIKDFGDVPTP